MTTVTFDPAVGGNGLQVSDQVGEVNTLVLGGHRQFFVPALQQTVAVAGSAVTSASSAASSANTATTKASEASASALSASQSAASAAASELAADADAASALASKQAAEVSASAALASEQLATTKASEAAVSALAASQSESAASASEIAAAASASAASASELAAAGSASAASASENSAGLSATAASASELAAASSASEAALSASAALASEQLASTKASEAATSAAQAELSTTTATSSADVAVLAANAAQGYSQAAEQFSLLATASANYKGLWSVSESYLVGDTVGYEGKIFVSNTANTARQPDLYPSDWFSIKYGDDLIRTPNPISPLSGDVVTVLPPTLEATGYAPLYSVDSRLYRRFEVALSSDTGFSSPVFTADVMEDTVSLSEGIVTLGGSYLWRCKDVSSVGESRWVTQDFAVANSAVNVPTITVTGTPSVIPENPVITKTAFSTNPPGQDTLLSVDWEIRLASNNVLVWSSYENTVDVESIQVPSGVLLEGTSYKFRARDRGTVLGVGGWGSITGQTKSSFFDVGVDIDGLSFITTIQQEWNPASVYSVGQTVIFRFSNMRFVEYRSLTNNNSNNNPTTSPVHWEVVFDNNKDTAGYFGVVTTDRLVADKGEWKNTTTYSVGDMVVVKAVPTPLTQNDLVPYVSLTNSNVGNDPTISPSHWEQRGGLPAPVSLAENIGLSGVSASILPASPEWMKFVHKGKIKYIAKKNFAFSLSWDDIAKAEAVYGNRTVRVGNKLFRVSLLTGAEADPSTWTTSSTGMDNKGAGSEWNELIYRVHESTPTPSLNTSNGGAQIGGNWESFSNAELEIGVASWCRESQASNQNARIIRGSTAVAAIDAAASSDTASSRRWRPCLTLVSEDEISSSLYKSDDTGPGPGLASLQYDPITDTGYYGEVSSAQLYTGTQVSTAVGLVSGTLHNDTEGWLKFYWHGQVVFVAKRTYRYGLSWDSINAANAVYGVNLGASGKKTIVKDSYTFDVKLLMGTSKDPGITGASGTGRQWNELMYRVTAGTESGEVGTNWATFSYAQVNADSGNGGNTWVREISQATPANRFGRGGVTGISGTFSGLSTSTSANLGWRPCLSLVR